MTFTISNSALNQFFGGCPARHEFFRRYSMKPKFMPKHLKFGIAVHEAIEKDIPKETADDARITAERLLNLADKNGYQILATEIRHLANLTDEIDVFGIIDALALGPDGNPVLLDWKTSSYPWEATTLETGELVTMKAMGWQGTIYLLEPYKMPIEWKGWPEELHYLIAPTNGGASIHKYYWRNEDYDNLVRAATMMKAAVDNGEPLPFNRGFQCRSCDWLHCCWQTPNWQRHYDERRGARDDVDELE